MTEYFPSTEPLVPTAPTVAPTTPHRWPWICAMVAALLFGVGIGILAWSDPFGERIASIEQREQAATAQEQSTTQRVQSVEQREKGLADRTRIENAALDTRKVQLDKLSGELAQREQALLPKEREAARSTIKGDGIFLVGKDINPGTYRNSGTNGCYWQRSSGTSGDFDEILANGNENGPAVVTIQASDVAFTAKRCGVWTPVN
ncbi:hypothetical protein FK531_10135 [Rhodococcus spelaei]|uniref:Uncharacterized protein n=1 Tax=Rhodococcus spelaei TaxID=2546320 RepID=A0A541B9W0_9NOCA|nr:hypothetical protein [Rhodococcus spelaei]TQF69120.1 hypothetical protein FK531_10135 [Rhodococcus spelaei]